MDNNEDKKARPNAGAKSKCTPGLTMQVCQMIIDGHTNKNICKAIGISEASFYAWLDPNDPQFRSEFLESVTLAREIHRKSSLDKATASLLEVALGHDAEESSTKLATDRKTGKVYVKEKTTYHKHFEPNVQALIFFLTNRDPENWKQRQTSEITGKDGKDLIQKEINLDELTDEQKAAILSLGEKALRDKEKNLED
jgi:hypothetical protein